MKVIVLAICLLAVVSGCTTIHSQAISKGSIAQYKTAFIAVPEDDEFDLVSAIAWELNDMGLVVVGNQLPVEPLETDLLVRFSYDGGWDFRRYLKTFSLKLLDARNKRIVAATSYSNPGFADRESRLEEAFNALRVRLGLPLTKQFRIYADE